MNDEFGPGASTVGNESAASGTFPGSAAHVEEQAAKYGQKVEEQAAKYGRKAVEAIDAGRTTAASGLGNAAAGLHAKADQLPGGETVSGFAHQTANKMSATAGYLRDHDVADIASEVKDFVKAHPTQAIIGAVVIGFLAGRAAGAETHVAFEDTRSIADVLKDIVGNLQQIIRAEIRLAKLEVREEASKVARAGALMAIGGLLGLFACGFLLWAGVYLLANVVAVWLATAIVGVVIGAIGGALIAAGRAQIKRVAMPPKTTATLQENVRWAKTQSN